VLNVLFLIYFLGVGGLGERGSERINLSPSDGLGVVFGLGVGFLSGIILFLHYI
jgi:hypothetical protein